MAVVSVTRLRLRSGWFMPAFVFYSLKVAFQSKRAEGCLGTALRKHGGAFWTVTLWRDEAAMRAFMLSGAHRKAMPHLVNWCDEAATARYDATTETLPCWEDAEARMHHTGRVSPVKHPSSAHHAGKTLGEHGPTATLGTSKSA